MPATFSVEIEEMFNIRGLRNAVGLKLSHWIEYKFTLNILS